MPTSLLLLGIPVPAADHGFATAARSGVAPEAVRDAIATAVLAFVRDVAATYQAASSPSATRITSTPTSSVEVVFSP